ncbi:MAG: protein phosphatase 2C domain-containing protein [Ruminococcus sp.]|nr:protein phosphatase 2C domain-containing protein [Ruminococcus sp.]
MSDDFNPLKDIFSKQSLEKFQNDTVNLISSVVRGSERSLNAFKDCLPTHQEDSKVDSHNDDTSSVTYECPFPQRNQTFSTDDIFNFNANNHVSSSEVIDVDYTEVIETFKEDIDTMNSVNSTDPFGTETSNSTHKVDSTTNQEVSTKDDTSFKSESYKHTNFDAIDPFSPADDISTDAKESKPLTDREVIDRTSSMWKYNPIKDTLELYPEYATETGTTPYARIVSSRVRGKKHKHNATNCDDYFKFSLVGNCCIVGVSDGAGSKAYSRVGAKEVTTSYVSAMSSAVETLLKDSSFLEGLSYPVTDSLFNKSCSRVALELQNAVKSAYSSLVSKFDDISKDENYSKPLGRKLSINDLSCTLLSAVIIPIETKVGIETFIATLQIGDGLICSIDANQPFDTATKILGASDSGSFSGETEFITANGMVEQSNLMRRIKVMKGKTSAILLATDGVADDYFPNERKSCNLYNDLVLNGIIATDIKNDNSIKIVPPIREQKTIEEVPKNVCVAYCEDIKEFFNISDEVLWNDKSFIQDAVSVYLQCFSNNDGMNLESWLDNYAKRGSFDDRTLFLYRPTK